MEELRTTLMLQRARRNASRKPVASSHRKYKGQAVVGVLFILLGLGLIFLTLAALVRLSPSAMPPTQAASPLEIPTATAATAHHATATTAPIHFSPTPATRVVCVSIGWVHVRFGPGDDQPVRGYLTEGETVILDSDQGNGDWMRLSSPVAGWVDARYLCETEKRP